MSNTRATACDGKIKYNSQEAADYCISLYHKEGEQVIYECKFCKKYHTASIKGAPKRHRRKHDPFMNYRDKTGPLKMRMKTKHRRNE